MIENGHQRELPISNVRVLNLEHLNLDIVCHLVLGIYDFSRGGVLACQTKLSSVVPPGGKSIGNKKTRQLS
jgi:hypothetical protein